jgi:uncharacterized protein (DUF488 family)
MARMAGQRLHTVGYEDRTPAELVGALGEHGVTLVVDVRLNPMSRRKGFSKNGLAATLADAGIGYRHERALGNPVDNRVAFRRGDAAARARMQAIVDGPAAGAVRALAAEVAAGTVALLCVERDHDMCHRSVVAAAVRDVDPTVEVVPIP